MTHDAAPQTHGEYTPLPPVRDLPETRALLGGKSIAATPEATGRDLTPGEIEYWRTCVGAEAYDHIYGDPDRPGVITEDYNWLVDAQYMERIEEWRQLRRGHLLMQQVAMRRKVLHEIFPTREPWDAVLFKIAISDIFKIPDNMTAVGLDPAKDLHDEGLPRLFTPQYIGMIPDIIPMYRTLTELQQDIVSGASSIAGVNWPGLAQWQAPPAVFGLLPSPEQIGMQAFEAFIVSGEADIAGAGGHRKHRGSERLDEATSTILSLLRYNVYRGGDPQTINDNFLHDYATHLYGVHRHSIDASEQIRIVTRMAGLARKKTESGYQDLGQVFTELSASQQEEIGKALTSDGINTPAGNYEYLPALFCALIDRFGPKQALEGLAKVFVGAEIAHVKNPHHNREGVRLPHVYDVNLRPLAQAAQQGKLDLSGRTEVSFKLGRVLTAQLP